MLKLPYAHLNLRRNPFGELIQTERAELALNKAEAYITDITKGNFVLQILGKQGRGKTTHLLALKQYFPDSPYVYYAEDEGEPFVPKTNLLFLDEMQRFNPTRRKELFKQTNSLVVASHENHEQEIIKQGKNLKTIELKGITKTDLKKILESRLEASRRTQGSIPYFTDEELEFLIAHFDDDLRGMFEFLYDIFQSLEKPGRVMLSHAI